MPEIIAHPSREQLSAYNLGQLPPDQAVAVESHISECEPCCDTIISLSSDDTFVGLLKEARQLPTDRTVDQAVASDSSSYQDVPVQLAEHPRYEILGLVGKGGMGDVYKARHRKMERTVALKVINRGLVRKADAVDRFHREVKAAAQLSHPNIVTAHDADQAGDFHFMVMEYVDGVDLSQTVKDRGALPVAEACDYIRQAAIGLQHAHERGMVHRDIKPHNMMVTADGTVKILDFGLASLAPGALAEASSVEARGELTAVGAIMGTPDFISPEQAEDARNADIRSDIYSLGATLYHLLSGQVPFDDGSVMHKLRSHAQVEPAPLHMVRDEVPEKLVAIASKMMAKDPDERYLTPKEVADALESFLRTWQPDGANSQGRQLAAAGNNFVSGVKDSGAGNAGRNGFLVVAAILVIGCLAAGLYYMNGDIGGIRVEVSAPEDIGSLGTHPLAILDTSGRKPLGGTSRTHQDDAAGITTHSFESANGRYKITLVNEVLTVNGDKYTLENPNDSIRIVDDRVEITRVADLPKDGGAEQEIEQLQGEWDVIAFTQDGKKEFAADQGVGVLVQIKGDTMTRIQTGPDGEKSETEWGRIELNRSTNPKAIDIVNPDGPGGRLLGIYELKDGALRICFAERSHVDDAQSIPVKRPRTFDAPAGSRNVLLECRRVDADPDLKQLRSDSDNEVDLGLLQGDWETVSLTESGKQLAAQDGFSGLLLQIKGDTFVIAERKPNGEKSEVDTGRIEVNSTATPKTIDFIGRDERRLGIYELKHGVLRVCLVEHGGTEGSRGERISEGNPFNRPTTFKSAAGSNMMLLEFRRKSDNALQTTEDARSLPFVQVLHDAEGLTAKRVKIIGTFLVTDDKFGVRSYKISTADEDLPPPSIGDAYSEREVTFAASFDEEKIINVGQFHNKRVLVTGPIYYFPSDSDSPAEVTFMMDGIYEYRPRANANEDTPNTVPGEGLSMLHNQPNDISEFSAAPMSIIRKAVLPQDIDAEGAGWERFRVASIGARGGTASGVPENLGPVLAKLPQPKFSLQKLADEVEAEIKQHPQWKAGVAVLGFLEAELGNHERAVKLFEQVLAEKEHPITPEAAWIFGLALEGKGPKLDQMVITLYEINVEGERDPANSLRVSAIGSLSRLYVKDGRRDEAKRLLQRLTEPEGPYVVCPWARGQIYENRCTECHQQERSLENYILMANALTDIGAPVEARMSLARISVSFKNAYDSDEAWAKANTIVPDWEYQGKEAFQPAKAEAESSITPQLILKALELGVFNEPNPLKTPSREPASSIDLILGVRGENGKSILFSPVIDMLALAARAKGADAEIANIQIDRMLAEAFQRNFSRNDPDQLEVGIAATVFAFLRNDLDAAAKRIETLNKPLPDEKARKAAVGLWLVAQEALKHERTREFGSRLAERALAAAGKQGDPLWAKAIREELLKHDQERKTDASINETRADEKRPQGVKNDRQ